MNYAERVYWNQQSYGSAIRIPKTLLRAVLSVLCIITPATNWMLPFVFRINDLVIRYDD
ncbi:MAG: hypothetical protein R6V53_00435 [Candidatus Woesearchaeota archaeon]